MNRIFVAALKEETPDLDFFHFTGVGKINATYNLKRIIDKYKPNEIIFTPNEWEHKDGISNIRTCPKCNYSQYTNVLKDKIVNKRFK